ncbi:MAG: transporter [Gemmatimonadota bacterium]|nr:transporter [Gemmatimonadota bacterium]
MLVPLESSAQQPSDSAHADQPMGDAWWTGPMLAASPNTLPHGHILIEPYFFDVHTAHSNFFGNLTYALYGLFDRLTVGSIINAGYAVPDAGSSSSGVGFGDLTLQATYRLTQFKKGGAMPTTAIVIQETLPTGKFDRLGARPSDGIGSGAYTTSVAVYGQSYFWLPNRRILRARVNLTQSFSHSVNLDGVSVYGTSTGFRGTAKPGATFAALGAVEYSITRSWVLALDVQFNRAWNTRVSGFDSTDPSSNPEPPSILFNSETRHSFAFAPAIEYSWTPNIGILLGTRIIPANPRTTHSITPAIAVNFVR